MQLDRFSDREDMEDAIAAFHNRLARAQGVQPIEHEDAKPFCAKRLPRPQRAHSFSA
jgi:hypothetical protein